MNTHWADRRVTHDWSGHPGALHALWSKHWPPCRRRAVPPLCPMRPLVTSPLQCKAPTTLDANCQKASNDPYCKRCDGVSCCACWRWRRVRPMGAAALSPPAARLRSAPPPAWACLGPRHAQTYDAPACLPRPPRCLQIYCIQCQPGYEFNDAYKVSASNAAARRACRRSPGGPAAATASACC